MKKDPRIHVSFILECIELVEEYLKANGNRIFKLHATAGCYYQES